jgi:hypothetical protein
MRVVDAMTLRDGGTTCVTVEEAGVLTHVTLDHRLRALAWLPRFRFVFTSGERFGRDRRLMPWGKLERRYVSGIARAAVDQLGHEGVRDFMSGLLPNPGQEHWFYVLNFLRMVHRSRLRNGDTP